MQFKKMSYKKIAVIIFLFAALLFTRFYNLDKTARFTQDESSDLARMDQYYKTKKITLVGPISNDGSKVFSSLSYYMVLPFAAAARFAPVGPVYGMAFYGVLTALLLLGIVYTVRKEWLWPMALLILVWYPLLEMSRWAWNPHFVAFWCSLGILAYFLRKKQPLLSTLVAGTSFGLMFHHHYVAALATGPFILFMCYELVKKKQFIHTALLCGTYILPLLVFALFDLRHPPGLFFGRYLFGGNTPGMEASMTLGIFFTNLVRNYSIFLDTLVKPIFLKVLLGVLVPLLVFLDFRSKKLSVNIWYIPALSIVFLGGVLSDFQVRYVYPALIFLFVWILMRREKIFTQFVATSIFLIILVGSLFTVWRQLTVTQVPPDMYSLTLMGRYIQTTIRDQGAKNANVAVLASPDSAPLGEKYRDLIGMDGTSLRAASEYELSENLFAITTSSYEDIQKDKSFAIEAFRKAKLKGSFAVPRSEWRVYWIGY